MAPGERRPQTAGKIEGMRTITVQTYRLRHHVRPFAADAAHPVVLHHLEGLRRGLLFAVNQRPGLAARHRLPSAR